MKATEKVSQETMPWSISSTKAVRVKDSRSPKLRDETHTETHTNHRKLLSSRWLGAVFSCKAQMAWSITNEWSAETKREVVVERKSRGQRKRSSMPQPGLLKKTRHEEEEEMGRRFAMQRRQTGLQQNSRGPSEGQQEPGSTVRRSIRTRKLH